MESEQNERKRPITYWIGEGGGWLLRHVVSGLAATGITPNMFTFLGLAVNSWAAALFAMGKFRQAAAVLFLAGFLDMADGQVARRVGRVTAFGAFLDSTLDRYSDLALYMGLVVYYTLIGRSFYMALAAVAMASSFMVSYSRARAESIIPSCKVGFMERPERLVLLIMGGVFNRMAQSAVGDRDNFDRHRDPSRGVHLAGIARRPFASGCERNANILSSPQILQFTAALLDFLAAIFPLARPRFPARVALARPRHRVRIPWCQGYRADRP